MIFESKMNLFNHGDKGRLQSYEKARLFLKQIPLNAWVFFSDIPKSINYAVIDLLDGGYQPNLNTVFDECFDKFLLTKSMNSERITYNLKRIYKPQ